MPSPIEDYALIGDGQTSALVSRDGSMDWLCLPRFDSPACFAALLGTTDNGRWQIAPQGRFRIRRRYRPHTLILETEFRTANGKVTLIDFMPIRENNPRIIRMVRGDRGTVRMQMDLVIRFDYGLTVPWVTTQRDGSLFAIAGPNRLILRAQAPMRGKGFHTVSDFTVKAGKAICFELRYGNSFQPVHAPASVKKSLKKTEAWWRKWTARCKYRGPFAKVVERSLITLKSLIYAPTGGIVAAPTTSLPEKPGGSLNWDYRYCWLRDATFTLLGFIHAGYHEEGRRWKNWLVHTVAGSADQLQVLYGVTGERLLREWTIPWLPGYQKSSPVRVANQASEQLQLDLFGELADVLHQARATGTTDGTDFDLQCALLEQLRKIWRKPDHGIWEVRGKKRHFTHSKVMAWVAFDRTIRSAEQFHLKAPLGEWREVRQEIHDDICKNGFNSRIGCFVQSYGSSKIDASLLLLPLVGFLPPLDPRVVNTVRRIEKDLTYRGFVMRFKRSKKEMEGAFLPCTFWLADYYELIGRRRTAKTLLKRVLRICNDVGLFSEEYHVEKKRLVGNFPQALTHVALVNTVINLNTKHGPSRQRSGHKRLKSFL
jgi:GH15 family glucan-1,4-alpha-glucosidase